MKIDGRKLSHEALEQIRITAVKRVQAGESPEVVIKSLGMAPSRIYIWLAAYRSGGWDALKAKKLLGRPKKLDAKQMRWIYKAVVGHGPEHYRFAFALWTRPLIAELIRRQFGVKLSLSSVGRLLAQMGLSCQRPLFRAWQQDRELAEVWVNNVYPWIKKKAKREGANIYFADESGIRSDFHSGTTWAPKGETPEVRVTGKRFGLNMISAVSPRGEMRFMVVEQTVTNAVFIEFLRRLLKTEKEKIYLIVDGHPTHRSKDVRSFIEQQNGQIVLFFLPSYSPELNPDELVWNDLKNNVVGRTVIFAKVDLKAKVVSGLRRIQKNPDRARSYFMEKNTKYAAF